VRRCFTETEIPGRRIILLVVTAIYTTEKNIIILQDYIKELKSKSIAAIKGLTLNAFQNK